MPLGEPALLAAYRRLEVPLYNVLYRMLWNPADCQDVAHDAFLRVWAQRARVREDTLDALVFATALNLARNRLRWQKLRQWVAEPVEEVAAMDDPASAAEREGLRRALATMPAAARDVLLLSEFGGLSGDEVARVLAIPVGTVGSRKHAALGWLRQALGEVT